jgi:hypothetical protein
VAAKAKAALPESNGRVEKAVQIVLAGDLIPYQDGRFSVGSQSDTTNYIVLDNVCDCPDFDKAPQHRCTHVIATLLWRRAYPLSQERMKALDKPASLPEAPASINVRLTRRAGRCS